MAVLSWNSRELLMAGARSCATPLRYCRESQPRDNTWLLVPWPCLLWRGLVQTEKTTAERELEQNLSFEWARVEERGQQLQPVSGPGLTGLRNLGNRYSCHAFCCFL